MIVSDALNTYNYAIDILKKKGYSIFLKDEDEDYILYLEKGTVTFSAEEPLSLLSLVYLNENNLNIHEDRIDFFMDNNTSFSIKEISNKGYNLSIENNSDWYNWIATNKELTYYASSPLKVLGLILIIEVFGLDWQNFDIPLYLNEL